MKKFLIFLIIVLSYSLALADYDTPSFQASRWYYNAIYHYDNLQIVKTINCLKEALKRDPNYKDAREMLDKIMRINKTPTSFKKILEKEADAYFNLGLVSDARGKFQDSKKFYNKVIEINKEYYTSYLAVSIVLKKLHLIELEIKKLEKFIMNTPMHLESRLRLAFYYRAVKKYDNAIEQFYKIKEISPYSDKLYYYLGLLLIKKDKFSEAIEEITRAVSINNKEEKYKKLLVLAKRLEKTPPKLIETQTIVSIQSKVNRLECIKDRERIKTALQQYNESEAFPMTELNLIILKNNSYLSDIPTCKEKGIYKAIFLPDNQIKISCSYHDKFETESIDEDNIDDEEIATGKDSDSGSDDDLDDVSLDDDVEIDLD